MLHPAHSIQGRIGEPRAWLRGKMTAARVAGLRGLRRLRWTGISWNGVTDEEAERQIKSFEARNPTRVP